MKHTKNNKIKSLVFVFMAMGISTLYVLAPFHKEIRNVCHNIAHFMEAPNSILEHNSTTESHGAHDHDVSRNGHEHHLMDFLGALLEIAPTEKSPMKTNSFELKIDKHLATVYKLKNYGDILCFASTVIWKYQSEPLPGYCAEIYVPPRGIHRLTTSLYKA